MDLNLTDSVGRNTATENNNKEEEKNDAGDDLLENIDSKPKSKFDKKLILIISISIVVVIAIIILMLVLFVFNDSDSESDSDSERKKYVSEKFRLKNWEFISSQKIDLTPEQISKGEKPELFNKAPEDVYVCTAMGGLAGHSDKYFYETELRKVNVTQFDDDWYFRSHFELEVPDSNDALILLHINGINYKSDVYVDGNLVATKDKIIGTFVKYTLDITKYLNKASKIHYVAFKMTRPYNEWEAKGITTENDLSISFVDWNPDPPDSNIGVWLPVEIEIFKKNKLTVPTVFINTKIIEEKKINLEIVLYIKNWENKAIENNFSLKLGDFIEIKDIKFTLVSLEEKQIVLNSDTYTVLNIDYDPNKLWWPYRMGNQQMYNLTITINDYNFTKEIGLRQIESEYFPIRDIVLYKINKRKFLIKGAGWCPDLFLRQSPENYYLHLKYVKDLGLNVIRLEGNSEGEEFFDYCDKMGILVIFGWCCCDAWQRWEQWDEEINKISDMSCQTQIRKLSPHPSVFLFILGSDRNPKNGVEERWRVLFQEEKWPNEILSSAGVYAAEGYPTGAKMSGPYSWVPPNYFSMKNSRNNRYGGAYGFSTEAGPGENPLRRGSIEKVFNETNIELYDGDSWSYHCGKKEGSFGDLKKLILPINERFGNISNFNDFMRKSSAAVYEGHRAMFEAFDCYRYDSTGIIQWMLNNAWPSSIWHLYDYFFAPSPSYFATKKTTEKIHILYNYENSGTYLNNGYFSDLNSNVNLDIYIIAENGRDILDKKTYNNINNIKADELREIAKLDGDYGNNYFIHYEYSYDGMSLTNTYFLNKQMDVVDFDKSRTFYNVPIISYADLAFLNNLENVTISVELMNKETFEDKLRYKFRIKNEGKAISLLLEIGLYQVSGNNKEMILPIIWSDNYFSIRGENYYETTAEFNYDENKELYLDIIGWNCQLYQKLN